MTRFRRWREQRRKRAAESLWEAPYVIPSAEATFYCPPLTPAQEAYIERIAGFRFGDESTEEPRFHPAPKELP